MFSRQLIESLSIFYFRFAYHTSDDLIVLFHYFLQSTMQKLQLKDLLAGFNNNQNNQTSKQQLLGSNATQQFLHAKSQKVQQLPLKKQLQIKRQSTYRTTQEQGDKWIGIVKLNREKDSLNFVKHQKDNAANVTFFPSTPLNDFHNKIEGQLKQMEIQSQGAVLKKQEAALQKLSKEQAKERLSQARKQRTIVFNQEIKRRRIAKIKSKLYHKIKKRQKLRAQSKRIEGMDAEERGQYMQKLAKQRIHQRITLRHKTKNKHIQDLLRFSKGNKNNIQDSINEVNRIRRQQLQKVNETFLEKMSEEYDDDNYRQQALKDLQREIDEIEEEKEEQPKKGIQAMKFMKLGRDKQIKQDRKEAQHLIDLLEGDEDKQIEQIDEQVEEKDLTRKKYGQVSSGNTKSNESKANNRNFIQKNLKTFINTNQDPQQLTQGIDINRLKQKYQPNRVDLDLKEAIMKNKQIFTQQNEAIMDNYRDFQAEKADNYIAELPTQSKKLKGWGSWAGPGISEPKVDHALEVKKKLAKIEQIKRKRRDAQMEGVIIRQTYNKNLKDYFVNKLPHNYNTVDQFEYLQDEKIGSEWNTLNQFKSNIKPKVITKAGQVIEAIKLPKHIEKGGKP